MFSKIKKSVFTTQFYVFMLLGSSILINACQEQGEVSIIDDNGTEVTLAYHKEFHLSDDNGNTMTFTLYSDDQILLDSYSDRNFVFRGLKQNDLFSRSIETSEDEENKDEENLDAASQISVLTKNVLVKLQSGYVGYSIEEKWEAPEAIQDRGFSWHDETPSGYDHCRVENNRCCWAIYATWRIQSTASSSLSTIVDGKEIRGRSGSPYYGVVGTYKLHMRTKYRKRKHRTLIYTNLTTSNPAQ